ncbi:MAG: alpha/beta hydrolase family esterase [Myxococcota bacterium]
MSVLPRVFLLGFLVFLMGCGDCDGRIPLQTEDGRTRHYYVHEPAGWDGETPLPLVMGLHGGGGDAAGFRDSSGWPDTANTHGFLAVFPEGTGRTLLGRTFATWNAGLCCGAALEEGVDDVAFLSAVLDDVAARYPIDEKRLYVTGHSNGSMMTLRLVCELSSRIAAAAPYGGQGVSCAPARAVPLLYTHGDADSCALYDGGRCGGCYQEATNELLGTELEPVYWDCPPVIDYVDGWVSGYGCTDAPTVSLDGDEVLCERWSVCEQGSVVERCTLEGGGHAYPGVPISSCSEDPESRECEVFERAVGPTHPHDFNEYSWRFFSSHALE